MLPRVRHWDNSLAESDPSLSRRPLYYRGLVYYMIVFIVLISASQALSRQKEPPASFLDPIGFYQKYISPVDGQRCPMYPSCSQYIRQGVKKHGLLKGWVMGFDRIVRCGRDEVKLSSPIWIKGEKHIFDPVENNDFWWSDK